MIKALDTKSLVKIEAFDKCFDVFVELKDLLHEMSGQINEAVESSRLIKTEYRDRGKFEAQLQVASDMLIFSMHTNIFKFNREHSVLSADYVKENHLNAYCGIINIYNFLADSFKYNRSSDEGYLIARIFVNRNRHFFVEGKRQNRYSYDTFGTEELTRQVLTEIIETAILYSVEFDLLVPPYDTQKIIAVEQITTKIENSKIQTGKRLGYKYNSDDV
ncbi:MAG: hypothetical protein K2F53_03265 [Rikenellaceae bacterium]|nr:hypothetical protein [Rikenellaceae bacterium]